MNRDELYSRGRALPPARATRNGTTYVAPTDTDAGGTWIASNEYGLTVCLLNYYHEAMPPAPSEPRSRGQLVLDAVSFPDSELVDAFLNQSNQSIYRPYTMLVFHRSKEVTQYRWGGRRLTRTVGISAPVTSSGFDFASVEPERVRTYHQTVPENPGHDDLVAFHQSHAPERGAYSICVHRSDGGTRAFSIVRVDETGVAFHHKDGPACEPGPESDVLLHLR